MAALEGLDTHRHPPGTGALIDSHAHLDDPKLADDEEGALTRARAAGVAAVVSVGADAASSRRAVEVAHRRAMVFATVGAQPYGPAGVTEADWEELTRLAVEARVVGIGESGLDFLRDHSPRDVQRSVFARHLVLAAARNLPMVVHCREAYDACFEVIRAERATPVRGVLHCFQGDAEAARGALDLGLFLGIGGTLTFPREDALRRVVAGLPLDRLLLETDAPYLTPRPQRGRNEPAYVRHTAACLAGVLGVPLERVAEATTANARALFGLAG